MAGSTDARGESSSRSKIILHFTTLAGVDLTLFQFFCPISSYRARVFTSQYLKHLFDYLVPSRNIFLCVRDTNYDVSSSTIIKLKHTSLSKKCPGYPLFIFSISKGRNVFFFRSLKFSPLLLVSGGPFARKTREIFIFYKTLKIDYFPDRIIREKKFQKKSVRVLLCKYLRYRIITGSAFRTTIIPKTT